MRLFRFAFASALLVLLMSHTLYASPAEQNFRTFAKTFPEAKMVPAESGETVKMLFDFRAASVKGAPEAKARNFLDAYKDLFGIRDAARELDLVKTSKAGKNRMVHFKQSYRGVPVLNAEIKILLNARGEIVRVMNGFQPFSGLNTIPSVSKTDAIREGWKKVYRVAEDKLTARELDPGFTALYAWKFAGMEKLVYAVGLPFPVPTENRVAFVDAHTGEFVRSVNYVLYERMANVFLYNPGADGTQAAVQAQIGYIEPGQTHTVGLNHYALNCVDEGETMSMFGFTIPVCTEKHLAETDANGDLLYTPSFEAWDHADATHDEFSEVHLFYHVENIYNYYRALGLYIDSDDPPFTTLAQPNLRCIANFKMPDLAAMMGGGTAGLVAFDNAMFTPQNGLIPNLYPPEDSIIFGQGENADFSYDADVIYHEFGHAVIAMSITLGQAMADAYGVWDPNTTLHEGLADFFSSSLAGNPALGEYVGAAFDQGSDLRNLDNDNKCPNDVVGESHHDGQMLAGALWELREHFKVSDDDHWDIDAAVFLALQEQTAQSTFTTMANSILLAIEDVFGTDGRTWAEGVIDTRGLIGCNRAVPVESGDSFEHLSLMSNGSTGLSPFTPAPMQFHFTLPEGVTYITLSFYSPDSGGGMFGGDDPDIRYLLKKDAPITYTYGGGVSATFLTETGSNEWPTPMQDVKNFTAVIHPPEGDTFAAGDWYVAPANYTSDGGMGGGTTLYYFTVETGSDTPPCHVAEDCGACEICENGACAPVVSECDADADCEEDETCVTDECGGVCESVVLDGDQPAVDGDDEQPADGDESGPECAVSMQCGDCEVCDNGKCVAIESECSDDEDCEDGQVCLETDCGGICQEDAEPEEDGDEPDGSAGTGGDGGCRQPGAPAGFLGLLMLLGLAWTRRREA